MICNRNLVFATMFLLIIACQEESPQDKSTLSPEAVAREIIKQSGTCTLITLDSLAQPRARIMDPFLPEEDFIIWFGTNSNSRKVGELIANKRATIIYYDKAGASYVSLYGVAEIVTDEDIKAQYWKSSWQNFYPDYPEGYCLIKFTPDYLELISEEYGITGDPITWMPKTIKF